jgi:serine/threonine protein kinase
VFKNRTIDLEAETEADRDLWVGNFEWLMKFSKESKVSSPVNVKHVAHVDKEFKWSGNDFEQQIELKKKIGEGAFGEVFLGVHRSAHLQFAIKMLDSQKDPLLTQEITVNSKLELSPEFESEINILKMCRHPNIVNFYGIWGPDKQDKLWIMMDFCVFGAVPDMIRIAEVQINEEQIKWIMKCTLLGLAYLHSKMIIHRDIKVNL